MLQAGKLLMTMKWKNCIIRHKCLKNKLSLSLYIYIYIPTSIFYFASYRLQTKKNYLKRVKFKHHLRLWTEKIQNPKDIRCLFQGFWVFLVLSAHRLYSWISWGLIRLNYIGRLENRGPKLLIYLIVKLECSLYFSEVDTYKLR